MYEYILVALFLHSFLVTSIWLTVHANRNWFRLIGYVGFDPSLNAVIVAHQGTNTSSLWAFCYCLFSGSWSLSRRISILTDFNIRKVRLNTNSTLFPGVSSSVEVHKGFLTEQARWASLPRRISLLSEWYSLPLLHSTASTILTAVNKTLNAHPGSGVALVGHSLGAAISLLDTVFLQLHLPSSTPLRMIGYGLPRVGNQAFADYVDQNITSLSSGAGLVHINNKKDPIPILPGMFLGYHHPSGEIHIQDSGDWDTCPGQ